MVSMSFPVGVPVSKFSLLLTRCTLLACNRSTISSRSLVLRARRLKSWIFEHGLELGPVHTLAADFFGEPFLDAVLFERFDLAGFVLFFGADADVCNFHGSTSLICRKIGPEISETFENKAENNPNFQDFDDALDAR